MAQNLTTIGFDADDTLWQNEQFFQLTQQRFAELLADYTESDHLMDRLLQAERRNLGHYGFGIKGFMLSMIETAIEVTDQNVPSSVIAQLIAAGQDMLQHPIELLPHAQETVDRSGPLAPRASDHQGRPAGSRAQTGAIGSGRSVPRGRDCLGQNPARL